MMLGAALASFPGRVGGEKWPCINCLHMHSHFCDIPKLSNIHVACLHG